MGQLELFDYGFQKKERKMTKHQKKYEKLLKNKLVLIRQNN